mmetsp:Transcript_118180/g.367491  ORF Transcript_118180/g.367491 Transcript_118180/m.367491 type:complete len:200 (-) Transcript_118180:18-617(-)
MFVHISALLPSRPVTRALRSPARASRRPSMEPKAKNTSAGAPSYIISLQMVSAFSFFCREPCLSRSAATRSATASPASGGSSMTRSQISVIWGKLTLTPGSSAARTRPAAEPGGGARRATPAQMSTQLSLCQNSSSCGGSCSKSTVAPAGMAGSGRSESPAASLASAWARAAAAFSRSAGHAAGAAATRLGPSARPPGA